MKSSTVLKPGRKQNKKVKPSLLAAKKYKKAIILSHLFQFSAFKSS